MTVPPFTEDPEGARPYFRLLRDLRDQIAARKLPGITMDVLSMGMSHDFRSRHRRGLHLRARGLGDLWGQAKPAA